MGGSFCTDMGGKGSLQDCVFEVKDKELVLILILILILALILI